MNMAKQVASIALLSLIALVWTSSNAKARKRGPMSENCFVTGAHYNVLLNKIKALEKRVDALEGLGKKAQAKALKAWLKAQKKWLKTERAILLRIARLKAEIRRIKQNRRMSKLAKKAAIEALRAEIRRLQARLKALRAKRKRLLPASTSPSADASAVKALSKALDGLNKALDRLIAQMKAGIQAPEVVKSLNRLLTQMKSNGDNIVGLAATIDKLRKQLEKESGPLPKWAGWHFRLGVGVLFTSLNGSGNIAVPLQFEGSVEYITRYHLGIRAGLNLGIWFTREQERGKTYVVAPFALSGHVSGIISWKYFSIVIPQVRVHFLEDGVDRKGGHLWTTLHAGLEFHLQRMFALEVLVGTAVHTELPRHNGLIIGFGIFYRY